MKISVHPRKINGAIASWCVSRREGGKRRRTFFSTKTEAEKERERLRLEVNTAGHAWFSLPAREREHLMLAYHEAQKRGIDLLELARKHTNGSSDDGLTLSGAIVEMIKAKDESGRSPRYTKSLRGILNSFARGRETVPFRSIGIKEVEDFLNSKNNLSRSTHRSRLSTLFKYAIRRGYRLDNPCERLEPVTIVRPPPAILSIEQVKQCLTFLKRERPDGLLWFILTCLCGLRPEEAQGTSKPDINVKEGWIIVEAQTTKVRQRRVVYPRPEAMSLLSRSLKKGKLPLNQVTRRRIMRKLRDRLGLKEWPKDSTRHSAISYWLPMGANIAQVAEMVGNSESIIKAHYKAIVTRDMAKQFWKMIEWFK